MTHYDLLWMELCLMPTTPVLEPLCVTFYQCSTTLSNLGAQNTS